MRCKICNTEKPAEAFYFKDRRTGRRSLECKECRCAWMRKRTADFKVADPEAYQAQLAAKRRGGKKGRRLANPANDPSDWSKAIAEWRQNRRSDALDLIPVFPGWWSWATPELLPYYAAVAVLQRNMIEKIKYLIRRSRDPKRLALMRAKNHTPEHVALRRRCYREMMEDPEKLAIARARGRQYFLDNKPSVYAYRKEQRETNPQYRIGSNLRTYIYQRVGAKVTSGQSRFREIVGCSIADFCAWLEDHFAPWMNWSNYGQGPGKWSIDHTRPCASFDLTNSEQVKQCFHFTNMLPMEWTENLSKGDTMPESTFSHVG